MKTLVARLWRAALALVVALPFQAAPTAWAQETDLTRSEPTLSEPALSFGLRAGAARSGFYGGAVATSIPDVDLAGGVSMTYRISDAVALQTEVLVTRRAALVEQTPSFGSTRNIDYTLGFVEVPLLVKTYLSREVGPRPYLVAGPYAGARIFEKVSSQDRLMNESNLAEQLRTWDYGLSAGIGLENAMGRRALFFDTRYNWGLTNLFDASGLPDFRVRGLTFMVGLGF